MSGPGDVRRSEGPCAGCGADIRPGESWALLDDGPTHEGCQGDATASDMVGDGMAVALSIYFPGWQ